MAGDMRIVVLGGGPCGLGACWRLAELGCDTFDLYEAADHFGGLAASTQDAHGFTWDIGGHVLFSHYDYFDRVMETVLPPQEWLTHVRQSWIWIHGRFVPYPFQNNIGRLPPSQRDECLRGLRALSGGGKAGHFSQWVRRTFGEGIAGQFMLPYNRKVWAWPLEEMSADWIGERVAVPDIHRIEANIASGKDDCSWGPNQRFRFPLTGGTGAIWRAVVDRLPANRLHRGQKAVRWDPARKIIGFADGSETSYTHLISTLALTELMSLAGRSLPGPLEYSSTHVVGVGVKGPLPETLAGKCWIYFPEDDCPFYRVTVLSNYSPRNVPSPEYWSLMAEVSQSPHKPVDRTRLTDDVLAGLRAVGLLDRQDVVESVWPFTAEHAYPIPTLGRDNVLSAVLPELRARGIYSRGRFGAWKYECGNMDHSFMQGVEAAEAILLGRPEMTVDHPHQVNARRIR